MVVSAWANARFAAHPKVADGSLSSSFVIASEIKDKKRDFFSERKKLAVVVFREVCGERERERIARHPSVIELSDWPASPTQSPLIITSINPEESLPAEEEKRITLLLSLFLEVISSEADAFPLCLLFIAASSWRRKKKRNEKKICFDPRKDFLFCRQQRIPEISASHSIFPPSQRKH